MLQLVFFLDFAFLILLAVNLFLSRFSSRRKWLKLLLNIFLISGFRIVFIATRYWFECEDWSRLGIPIWILVNYRIVSDTWRLEIGGILF